MAATFTALQQQELEPQLPLPGSDVTEGVNQALKDGK